MNTTAIGSMGEDAACSYLESKGYKIICRNYKCKIAEIDIVAYDDKGVLCFCEVKTRKNSNYGYAYEAVNSAKIQKIHLGAQSFVKQHRLDCPMRCDVVEVYARLGAFGLDVYDINHITDAF